MNIIMLIGGCLGLFVVFVNVVSIVDLLWILVVCICCIGECYCCMKLLVIDLVWVLFGVFIVVLVSIS